MKYALIHNGQIHDIVSTRFPVADAFQWVECADDANPNDHTFDTVSGTVEARPVDIAALRVRKKEALTQAFETRIRQPVTAVGRAWPADPGTAGRLTRALAAEYLPAGINPISGGRVNNPTLAQMKQILESISAQEFTAQGQLETLFAAVDGANTATAIDAITWV